MTNYLVRFLCVLILNLSTLFNGIQAQTNYKKPNIIVILADDLGWTDLSCFGSTFYETPNLNQLAKDGFKFSQAYAASPVCSPTRASLLTGKYPTKTGVTDWIKGRQENGKAKPYEKLIAAETKYQLELSENTFAEYAQNNGYKTFFAGKWHLGEEEKYWPQHHGFMTNIGGWSVGSPKGKINDSVGAFFTPYKNPMLSDGPLGEYLTDRLTNECISFLSQQKDEPFLMFHSMYAVHNPLQAPKALIEKYKKKQQLINISQENKFDKKQNYMQYEKDWKERLIQDNAVYAAMIENMDWNIGRMIEELKKNGLYENTIIIFTSDNGGLSTAEGSPTSNAPLKAGKGWLYEGGIRVPFIMKWHKNSSIKTKVGNNVDIAVNTVDIFPTVATAVNMKYKQPKELDGLNLATIINKPTNYSKRQLFWHYPHYSNQGGKPGAVIREGKYKLIYFYEDESIALYNLEKDISEKNNLANTNKKLASAMKLKLMQWLKNNAHDNFILNPNYNK